MILEACVSTVEGLKAALEFNINRVEIYILNRTNNSDMYE